MARQKTATWVIQRCTQKWVGTELQYEEFPTPGSPMSRAAMLKMLSRVNRDNPNDEFRGHNTALDYMLTTVNN